MEYNFPIFFFLSNNQFERIVFQKWYSDVLILLGLTVISKKKKRKRKLLMILFQSILKTYQENQ